jgi:hypothetical protein
MCYLAFEARKSVTSQHQEPRSAYGADSCGLVQAFQRRKGSRSSEAGDLSLSPKIARQVTLSCGSAHRLWLAIEADAGVVCFCEHPLTIRSGAKERAVDFRVNRTDAEEELLCLCQRPDAIRSFSIARPAWQQDCTAWCISVAGRSVVLRTHAHCAPHGRTAMFQSNIASRQRCWMRRSRAQPATQFGSQALVTVSAFATAA